METQPSETKQKPTTTKQTKLERAKLFFQTDRIAEIKIAQKIQF